MKLFCIPHAGGSASSYHEWKSDNFQVIPVELPGRGRRFHDTLCRSIDETAEDIVKNIIKELNGSDYALFGHSMGAVLCYEVYYKLRALGYKKPVHIFLSAKMPPHSRRKEITHHLPEEEFRKTIASKGGTPGAVFQNEELWQLCYPILCSDIRNVELYEHKIKECRVESDITLIYGTEDEMLENSTGSIHEWKQYAGAGYREVEFSGDHFYLIPHRDEVLKLLSETLAG